MWFEKRGLLRGIVTTRSVAGFKDPWLGDKVNSGIGLSYRPASHVAWRAYTTILRRSWLYHPSQGLWIRLLVINAGFTACFKISAKSHASAKTIILCEIKSTRFQFAGPQSRQSAKLFSSRGIGTPPTPHPQASGPPPPGSGGRGTLAGERGGGRVPIPTRGHTLWYSIYIYVLCAEEQVYLLPSP